MRCAADEECVNPDQPVPDAMKHAFAGYGFFIKFHKECCPIAVDGTTCDDHDDEVQP